MNTVLFIELFIAKVLAMLSEDGAFVFPMIGAIHLIIFSLMQRSGKLFSLGVVVFLLILLLSPFIYLLPDLGVDSFSEAQNFAINEALFYITTLQPLGNFGGSKLVFWVAVCALYCGSLLALFRVLKRHSSTVLINKVNIALIASLIVLPLSFGIVRAAKLFVEAYETTREVGSNFEDGSSLLISEKKDFEGISLLLYIGESTTSMHLSIYGYPRPTSAKLQQFADRNPLVVVDGVLATHTHTTPSLLEALSVDAVENLDILPLQPIEKRKRVSIVNILKYADIETILFSNQDSREVSDKTASVIFNNASHKIFGAEAVVSATNNRPDKLYDHVLFSDFTKYIAKQAGDLKSLYVFHSYAGHGPYRSYLPKSYRSDVDDFYTGMQKEAVLGYRGVESATLNTIEQYDSAMRYVSDSVAGALEYVANLDRPMVMIYTADHGESPMTGRGHDSSRFIAEMVQVPFLIFFNEAAIEENRALYQSIKERLENTQRASLANLPSLIFAILGVDVKHQNGKVHAMMQCQFGAMDCIPPYTVVRKRLDGIGFVQTQTKASQDQEEQPLNENKSFWNKMKFFSQDKEHKDNTDSAISHANLNYQLYQQGSDLNICFPRSNSIARIIRGRSVTDCIELDITVQGNVLSVFHSPKESTNLTLDKVLETIGSRTTTLWIDAKNIDSPQHCEVLSDFVQSHTKHSVNFFIEFPPSFYKKSNLLRDCGAKITSRWSQNFIVYSDQYSY